MKIAMICASPKQKSSASESLLGDLKACFSNEIVTCNFSFSKAKIEPEDILQLRECDALVFAFPLYVDAVPSHLLSCLMQMEKAGFNNKDIMVYCVVNSGFYEGRQNAIAIEVIRNWCVKAGLKWGMGVGVGGGGGLAQMKSVPLGAGPKTSLGSAYKILAESIEKRGSGEDVYISVDFPRFLYVMGAQMGWRQMIKANGKKAKDLGHRL